jgi:hypothetical protein
MNVTIAALLACLPAILTLEMESRALAGTGILFLMPGIFGAMAASGNAHAFHLWVAAAWNFVFYFLLFWAIVALIGWVLRRIAAARRVGAHPDSHRPPTE